MSGFYSTTLEMTAVNSLTIATMRAGHPSCMQHTSARLTACKRLFDVEYPSISLLKLLEILPRQNASSSTPGTSIRTGDSEASLPYTSLPIKNTCKSFGNL